MSTSNQRQNKKSKKGRSINTNANRPARALDQISNEEGQDSEGLFDHGAQAMDCLVALRDETLKKNTQTAYDKWQGRWFPWCEKRKYPTGDLVTEKTLADFLFNHVLVTVFDTRKRTRADTEKDLEQEESARQRLAQAEAEGTASSSGQAGSSAADEEDVQLKGDGEGGEEVLVELTTLVEEEGTLENIFDFSHIPDPKERKRKFRNALLKRVHGSPQGHSSLNQCIAAIVSLYDTQASRSVNKNEHPHPSSRQITTLKTLVKHEHANRKAEQYEDKGKNKHYDGFTNEDDILKVLDHYWSRNSEAGLRDLCAFTLGIYGMLRGDNQRGLKLSDLSHLHLPKEGAGAKGAWFVVFGLTKGKTHNGTADKLTTMMRHRNVFACGVFALAATLFARFALGAHNAPQSDTPFPNMLDRRRWYGIWLFPESFAKVNSKGKDKGKPADFADGSGPISYTTQNDAVSKGLKSGDVDSSKTTHIGRKTGAMLAELAGVPGTEIARHGCWAGGAMEDFYLQGFSFQTMRGLADFSPLGGDYYLERDIDVPESLLRKVFPEVEKWETELKSRTNKREQDKAGLAFLRLMKQLRICFIQDAPHHRKRRPNHFIFTHAIFSDPEYLAFEERALLIQPRTAQDFDDRLKAHAPHMTTVIQSNFAAILTEVSSNGRQLGSAMAQFSLDLQEVNENQFKLKSYMDDGFRAVEQQFSAVQQQMAAVLYQTAPERTAPLEAEFASALTDTLAGIHRMAQLKLCGTSPPLTSSTRRRPPTSSSPPFGSSHNGHHLIGSSHSSQYLHGSSHSGQYHQLLHLHYCCFMRKDPFRLQSGEAGGFSFAKTTGGPNDQKFWNRRVCSIVHAVEALAAARRIPAMDAADLLDGLRRSNNDTLSLQKFSESVKGKTGLQISSMI